MRIVKRIGLIILALIVLVLVVALFVKKDYAVERQVVINKPRHEVFEYIRYLKNQDNYSVWVRKDPNVKKSYKGTDGTVGFISYWDSENKEVGKGEQEIAAIVPDQRMDLKLRFKIPFEAHDDAYFVTDSTQAAQTTVKWGFTGKMPYPMNAMMLVMNMDKMIGKDLDGGLQNLKGVLEK
jgi:uncharacterized membrane protein